MKVAVRVDGSRVIGTGHVRRTLSLAASLRDCGAEVRFVTRDLGIDSAGLIGKAGFAVATLPAPDRAPPLPSPVPHAAWAGVAQEEDAAQTVAALRDWAPDWMVVDHYAFDAAWHAPVRAALGCGLAAIDDLADRPLAADLLIDHNHAEDHRALYARWVQPGTIILGGPRFALLGPAFAEAPRYRPSQHVRSIGIFMGGVDQANVTETVLAAIGAAGFKGEVEAVSTSANPNLARLRDAVAARPGTRLNLDLPDLAAFLARHDLQVGAGGGASWERCCIGAPTLLLIVADNQRAVARALVAAGAAASPEPDDTLAPAGIGAALRALIDDPARRLSLSEQARLLADGLGARRVALRMLADSLAVRPAGRADAERMHRWRNHPATRAVSRSSGEIGWDDHLDWLDRTLADPTRTLLVGMVGSLPVGVIRFDRLDEGRAEVSLYLDPALHGLGLGRAMLLAAEPAAGGLDILAEVLEGNVGSARLFESAGYRRLDATHWLKPAADRTQTKTGKT